MVDLSGEKMIDFSGENGTQKSIRWLAAGRCPL
jgi:hypothetical protein